MNTLSRKQLLHLPVETRAGQQIGSITDFEIDADTQTVWRYEVANGDVLIPGLFGKKLFISPTQVVTLDSKKMVVEDAVVKDAQFLRSVASS